MQTKGTSDLYCIVLYVQMEKKDLYLMLISTLFHAVDRCILLFKKTHA